MSDHGLETHSGYPKLRVPTWYELDEVGRPRKAIKQAVFKYVGGNIKWAGSSKAGKSQLSWKS